MAVEHSLSLSLLSSKQEQALVYWTTQLDGRDGGGFAPDPAASGEVGARGLIQRELPFDSAFVGTAEACFALVAALLQHLLGRLRRNDQAVVAMPRPLHLQSERSAGRDEPLWLCPAPRQGVSLRDLQAEICECMQKALEMADVRAKNLAERLPGSTEEMLSRAAVLVTLDRLHGTAPVAAERADVAFCFAVKDDRLVLHLTYRADLYLERTMQQVADQWERLATQALVAPDHPLADFEWLPEQERQLVLHEFNRTEAAFESDRTVSELFERQAASDAERTACAGLSYRELNEQANRLAHYLQNAWGLQPDDRVGLLLDHTAEMVVSMLAVLKTGAAYVPVDPAFPAERIHHVMADSGMKGLVTVTEHAEAATADCPVLLLDRAADVLERQSTDNLAVLHRPEHLAYVIYTSGSTGLPKGVMVEHRHVVNFFHAMDALLQPRPDDRMLAVTTYSFDISVLELLWTLTRGVEVVLHPNDEYKYQKFDRYVQDRPITMMQSTPSRWKMIVEDEQSQAFLQQLRRVLVGGEALTEDLVKSLFERLSANAELWNLYGPTETTIWSSAYKVEGADSRLLIGKPIANTQVYILDECRRPVSIGQVGEIYIGGAGVTRGYWQREDLNAERYVPNPFAAGGRLYRTGDLGRFLPDGQIDCLGRVDFQVKIHGYRIETGEIEAQLLQHQAVKAAIVLAQELNGDPRLLAFLIPQDGKMCDTSELRRFLEARLPAYMLPAGFVSVDEFPLTPNGKADRRALLALGAKFQSSDAPYLPPRTQTERQIAEMFATLLPIERAGVQDHFFRLGGHSLLATRAVSHIQRVCGVRLTVRDIFQQPTVEALAAYVETLAGEASTGTVERWSDERAEERPCSLLQEQIWLLHQMDAQSPLQICRKTVEIRGAFQPAVWTDSYNDCLQRHDVLRTTFRIGEGQIRQVVSAHLPVEIPLTEVSDLAKAKAQLAAQADPVFDLGNGPLLTAHVIKVADDHHLFTIIAHAIVMDEWSLDLLFRELAAGYDAYLSGGVPHHPQPMQYVEFARWQRDPLQNTALQQQIGYWKRQLGPELPVVQLLTDRPRPAVPTYRGKVTHAVLPQGLRQALVRLSQAEGTTLFMTLLTAWNVFLHRVTGREDIVVASPVTLRHFADSETVIGPFENTLLLCSRLSDDPSFRELLTRTREIALDAYGSQDVPLGLLVRELQLSIPDQHALYHILFTMEPHESAFSSAGGVEILPFATERVTANCDLKLSARDGEQGLVFDLTYNEDLFDETTIRRLFRQFCRLLEAATADADRAVSCLSILPEEERAQLAAWNNTASPYPQMAVHRLFEKVAEERPDAVALVWNEQTIRYGELNKRANRLARHLQQHGVKKGDLVGICLDRSPELIIGLLAILKAGGAYVPLDPTYPEERLTFMLEDSGVQVLLTAPGLMDTYPQSLVLQEEAAIPGTWADGNLDVEAHMEDPANMIYTSGSTGLPKGALITQRGVVRLVKEQNYATLTTDHTFLSFASISFDASTFEIWGSLLNGAKLVLFPTMKPSLSELGEVIRNCGVTTLLLTAGLFHQMVEHHVDDLRGVKQLLAGGDVLRPEFVSKVLDQVPGCRVINVYGPTENTTFTTCGVITSSDQVGASVTIGPPVANTTVYVLDRHLRPLPIGVPGELYTGGDGLARGYHKRPDLTEERFLNLPEEKGGRLYKTGDLVRWLPNGTLEFLGRLDNQVKIRGFRIELGEIEARLLEHAGVSAAHVSAREYPEGKRLIAYYTEVADAAVTAADLRDFLKQRLPEYMQPFAYLKLDAFPLTNNGKVDYRALPIPTGEREEATVYVAPRTDVERQLAALWSDVLDYQQPGVTDDFFALGGHSLLATQLLSRIYQTFRVELPLRLLFAAPTLEQLADEIERRLDDGSTSRDVPFLQVNREDALPLSYAQQRLWFIEQLDQGTPTYNNPIALRLKGDLNVEALERTLAELVRRHESLRTRFAAQEGTPVQIIEPHMAVELPLCDLSDLPVGERETRLQELADQDANRPFDLTRLPLVRFILFRLDEADHVLYFCIHHIIYDGWSQSLMVREIASVYQAFVNGKPSPLPEPLFQYADYAHWQHRWLEEDVIAEQMAYWLEKLGGHLPVLQLPTDHPRTETSGAGRRDMLKLPAELTGRLKALSQQEGATLFMTLLAGFKILLQRYTGQEDLLIGSPIANRTRVETEEMIGFFVNTIVLRSDLSNNPTFLELLQQVRETTLEAYSNQDVPFEKLVEVLRPERSLSHTPLFQVMFVLQNTPPSEFRLSEETIVNPAVDRGTSIFDLSFDIEEHENQLYVTAEYNSDLFDVTTMMRMLHHYRLLLEDIAAAPDRPIGSFNLLTDIEKQQLLVEFNDTTTPFPQERTVFELVEEQAQRNPERIALRFQEQTVTYGELNARANQLAQTLLANGLTKEGLVGLLLDRSPLMVEAILAIWKAGGAYIPLDPDYPSARITGILQDSGAQLLLSRSELVEADVRAAIPDRVILLDLEEREIRRQATENVQVAVEGSQLAYVIYTSGSTGKPKGAMVEQVGMMNHIQAKVTDLQVTADSIVAQNASHCFDISIWQFFVALVQGGTTIVYDNELVRDPERFIRTIAKDRVTILEVVPTVLSVILDLLAEDPLELPALRHMLVTGETVKAHLVKKWFDLYPQIPLVNAYGPTEASDDITHYLMTEPPELEMIPVGYPIQNFRIYIVDAQHNLCPIGVKGEICVAGIGVGRGYLNDPERTKLAFLEDPFQPNVRLYKTGDLGRWLPDGRIEFFGRKDYQVKIRGFRIELGEIENKLADHPHVKEAVVLDHEAANGTKSLCGYVVLRTDCTVQSLREHLQESLPDYMVPAHLVKLEQMPLTANGKIDRKALPRPTDLQDATDRYVPPQDDVQAQLVSIWQDVLDLERIGIRDNFFECGGHSLKATVLTSRINRAFNVQLALRDVFRLPTIEELAVRLYELEPHGYEPITPVPLQKGYALSSAQRRMLILNERNPGSLAYNVPDLFLIEGAFDSERFAAAIRQLIARHEALRTSFTWAAGEPVQIVHDTAEVAIRYLQSSEARLDADIQACLQPFDLSEAPLLHVHVIRLTDERHVLMLDTHHIVTDGISSVLLLQELWQLYKGEVLPPLRLHYKDFAAWQNRFFTGEELQRQEAYWLDVLQSPLPVLELPYDAARAEEQQFDGDVLAFSASQELAERLQDLALQTESTLFMVLLAAYNVLLAKFANQEDILVGTPTSGRQHPDTEQIVGMFVNTLVMRNFPAHDKTFRDFLAEVKRNVLQAFDNQDYPFERLIDKLHVAPAPGRNPLFDTVFAMQNFEEAHLELETTTITAMEPPSRISKFDLTLFAMQTAQGLAFRLEYATRLFARQTAERIGESYLQVLQAITDDGKRLIRDIEVGGDYHVLESVWEEEIEFNF